MTLTSHEPAKILRIYFHKDQRTSVLSNLINTEQSKELSYRTLFLFPLHLSSVPWRCIQRPSCGDASVLPMLVPQVQQPLAFPPFRTCMETCQCLLVHVHLLAVAMSCRFPNGHWFVLISEAKPVQSCKRPKWATKNGTLRIPIYWKEIPPVGQKHAGFSCAPIHHLYYPSYPYFHDPFCRNGWTLCDAWAVSGHNTKRMTGEMRKANDVIGKILQQLRGSYTIFYSGIFHHIHTNYDPKE